MSTESVGNIPGVERTDTSPMPDFTPDNSKPSIATERDQRDTAEMSRSSTR